MIDNRLFRWYRRLHWKRNPGGFEEMKGWIAFLQGRECLSVLLFDTLQRNSSLSFSTPALGSFSSINAALSAFSFPRLPPHIH